MKSKSKTKKGLTNAEEKKLLKSINNFSKWLEKRKVVKSLAHINHTVDMPFANEDWVMKVNDRAKSVSFNTFVREKCSFEYYQSIVLHEFFHLAVQRVPNKEDAVRVKDDFGDELMKLIDIEADYFTALYFKEELGYNLVNYLRLYFEGSRVFSDRKIRAVKLERFIGTLLSIFKMFVDNQFVNKRVITTDLYLPTISPVYTEDSLHVLVIRKEHIYFDTIKASFQDFVDIKDCYTNIDSLTLKGYTEKLINFCCKAFNIGMPKKVKSEIDKIK